MFLNRPVHLEQKGEMHKQQKTCENRLIGVRNHRKDDVIKEAPDTHQIRQRFIKYKKTIPAQRFSLYHLFEIQVVMLLYNRRIDKQIVSPVLETTSMVWVAIRRILRDNTINNLLALLLMLEWWGGQQSY